MKLKFLISKINIVYFICFFADILFSELVVRIFTLGFKSGFPIFMILFAVSIAFLLATLCSVIKGKARGITTIAISVALMLIYSVQLVYFCFCDSFMSVVQIGMGGDALTKFGTSALQKIFESLGGILLLLLPTVVFILLFIKRHPKGRRMPFSIFLIQLVIFLALHFGAVACLPIAGTQLYSPYDTYHDTFILSKSEQYFGVLTSLRLELRGLFFGATGGGIIDIPDYDVSVDTSDDTGDELPPKIEYPYNTFDIDFEELIANENDENILELHKYFRAQDGTRQNEYTGMFKGYNLILICAESFSGQVIDKDRTPTLYKLANEGFIFKDYYNTVCDNTSNGEYAILTGLIPDTSLLGKGWDNFYDYNSFTVSKRNLFPFSLGNRFSDMGAETYAFHNYYYTYYGRYETHPNLGYNFKAMSRGLKYVDMWPTSDVSMMEQSLPMLLKKNEEGKTNPFHAYFLTFSGHMPYSFSSNDMAIKNKSLTSSLPYPNKVNAYIACQQEFEYAMTYLLEQLEANGVLDNTLIAITNDHYPYPLGIDGLSALSGKELDEHFDKYRSTLLLWSASMEAPIEVDTTCCSLDILPTLSNLLGLEYDSRLLMGKDIFADGPHTAILADRSFITDKVFYNCTNGEVVLREGVSELPEGYIDRIQAEVKNKFTVSEKILYNDYYRAVFEESITE